MSVNPKLFTVCNRPVKIFLEGFTYLDILRVTKLIITHGGQMVSEPDDDTIVLASSGGWSTARCVKFSVNWVHNCVSSNEFLDIMKYILPLAILHSKKHSTGSAKLTKTVESRGNTSTSSSPPKNAKIPEATKPLRVDLPSTRETGNPEREDAKKIARTAESSNRSGEIAAPCKPEDSDPSKSIDRKLNKRQPITDSHTEPKQKKPKTSSSISQRGRSHTWYYTERENQSIINYLIENNCISDTYSLLVWKKVKAKGMFAESYRSPEALRNYFHWYLLSHVEKYTNDEKALRAFKKRKHQSFLKYSEEEERRIIQYLTENDVIAEARTKRLWRQVEAKKIFTAPMRSAEGLYKHFRDVLQYFYMNYTDDPQAVKKFEKLRKQQTYKTFS